MSVKKPIDTNNVKNVNVDIGVATVEQTYKSEPAGARIPNNHVLNPTFDLDSNYPNCQYIKNPPWGHNGTEASDPYHGGDPYPIYWSKHNPLYNAYNSSTQLDFSTYAGHTFLNAYKTDDGTYKDDAEIVIDLMSDNSTFGSDSVAVNKGDQIPSSHLNTHLSSKSGSTSRPVPARRALSIYGAGDILDTGTASGVAGSVNNNLGRKWGDPVSDFPTLVGFHNSSITPTAIDAIGNFDHTTTEAAGCWVLHEWCQSVQIPVGATKVRYGAYFHSPESDELFNKNLGGMYIKSQYNGGPLSNYTETVKTDMIAFAGAANPSSFATPFHSSSADQYQFSGLDSHTTNSRDVQLTYAWTTNQITTGTLEYYKTATSGLDNGGTGIHSDFTLVSRTRNLDGTDLHTRDFHPDTDKLLLSLFFAENCANLNSPSSSLSGSIQFYCPFVQFFDSSDNVISP